MGVLRAGNPGVGREGVPEESGFTAPICGVISGSVVGFRWLVELGEALQAVRRLVVPTFGAWAARFKRARRA